MIGICLLVTIVLIKKMNKAYWEKSIYFSKTDSLQETLETIYSDVVISEEIFIYFSKTTNQLINDVLQDIL